MRRSELQYEIAIKLALLSRRFRARFAERVRQSSQTEARWSALYQLSHEPSGLIQSELAERMGIQGPTLVRLLDALEAQGLVQRVSTPEDRRAKRVVIQPAGLRMVGEVDVVAAQLRNEAFDGIDVEDLAVTLKAPSSCTLTRPLPRPCVSLSVEPGSVRPFRVTRSSVTALAVSKTNGVDCQSTVTVKSTTVFASPLKAVNSIALASLPVRFGTVNRNAPSASALMRELFFPFTEYRSDPPDTVLPEMAKLVVGM